MSKWKAMAVVRFYRDGDSTLIPMQYRSDTSKAAREKQQRFHRLRTSTDGTKEFRSSAQCSPIRHSTKLERRNPRFSKPQLLLSAWSGAFLLHGVGLQDRRRRQLHSSRQPLKQCLAGPIRALEKVGLKNTQMQSPTCSRNRANPLCVRHCLNIERSRR